MDVRRVRSVLAFWVRTSYVSRFGGSQNTIAVMCGGKQRGGAAMLGKYPRAKKCRSMLVFPEMIASWQGEDVQSIQIALGCLGVGWISDPPRLVWAGSTHLVKQLTRAVVSAQCGERSEPLRGELGL